MKVTKKQLKRIIREEKRKLAEQSVPGEDIIDGYYNAITELIFNDMAAAGIDPHENPEEIEYAIRALNNIIMDLQAGNY